MKNNHPILFDVLEYILRILGIAASTVLICGLGNMWIRAIAVACVMIYGYVVAEPWEAGDDK